MTVPSLAKSGASSARHFISSHSLTGPFPDGSQVVCFGMGCFWGAERLFWSLQGVYVTAVGYQGGHDINPTYEAVCKGETGHTEVVKIVFDPAQISFKKLLKIFWEQHDPTQGMRQGNDVGTQYRSAIFTQNDEQKIQAEQSKIEYDAVLQDNGFAPITTEIGIGDTFYIGEEYHQQYLAKNPNGYCGIKGSGIACPIALP